MNKASLIGTAALAVVWVVAPLAAMANGNGNGNGNGSVQRSCSAKTSYNYGFQCQGSAEVIPGQGLEPVTFVGNVSGSPSGMFEGAGTFNTGSFGATRQRIVGPAVFSDRSCAGSIRYSVFLQLPGGSEVPVAPLYIDFVTVAGGDELLGVPTAPAGVVGAAVPRMVCRLVKVRGD